MPGKHLRTYTTTTTAALQLLARQIRLARKERRLTEAGLAERVGIARSTLQLVEKGDPRVEIGIFLEAAVVAGVPLFGDDGPSRGKLERLDDKLALLPKSVRPPPVPSDFDDF